MQEDALLRETVDLVLACAYGWGPGNSLQQVPSRAALVVVSLHENACSPLSSPRHPPVRDETLYVYFQQLIQFKVITLLCNPDLPFAYGVEDYFRHASATNCEEGPCCPEAVLAIAPGRSVQLQTKACMKYTALQRTLLQCT